MRYLLLQGNALTLPLADNSVHVCVTSPPYWNLRDYGIGGQLGLEATISEFIANMVAVFEEVRRVLRPDGVCWVNIGDSYACHPNGRSAADVKALGRDDRTFRDKPFSGVQGSMKPKDRCLIPFRLAIALQEAGWWVRSDCIWSKCLSGGTRVYAKTKNAEGPMFLKDIVKLDPASVQLWNGQTWTQAVAFTETPRPAEPLEIELRSGERIGCTPNHVWPTQRGDVRSDELLVGDVIRTCRLPEPEQLKCPKGLDDEKIGWFVGLYLAEGSKSDTTIQISGHMREKDRFLELCEIASAYHGTCRMHNTGGNRASVNLYGPILEAILETYVEGRTAKDKHLNTRCWQRSNTFLKAILHGYLSGDGHFDAKNNRWRLGFTNNNYLVADLRTLCSRLGISLRLRRVQHTMNGRKFPGYQGEIRFQASSHWNAKDSGEVVGIGRSRARRFWDVSVEDEPHLFSLASGVLTHNSNPLPESVKDRPACSHEYILMLTKRERYYFDAIAVREPAAYGRREWEGQSAHAIYDAASNGARLTYTTRGGASGNKERSQSAQPEGRSGVARGVPWEGRPTRNLRTVWHFPTQPYPGSHFATFPEALVRPCVLAGPGRVCSHCGAPWERVTRPTAEYAEHFGSNNGADADRYGAGYRKRSKAVSAAYEPVEEYGGKLVETDPQFSGRRMLLSLKAARERTGDHDNPFPCAATAGWRPTCSCYLPFYVRDFRQARSARKRQQRALRGDWLRRALKRPGLTSWPSSGAVVIDPFAGSGTVGVVALRHGRNFVGVDLNGEYLELARARIEHSMQNPTKPTKKRAQRPPKGPQGVLPL